MGSFDSKETTHPEYHEGLRDANKSLGRYILLFYFSPLLTIGLEDQAQCDSSSTFSGRESEISSMFDPNYDGDDILGACLLYIVV